MSMSAGTVTVTGIDPTTGAPIRTGSGLALPLFDNISNIKQAAGIPPVLAVLGSTASPFSVNRPVVAQDVAGSMAARLAYFQDLATTVKGLVYIITYIQANAVVDLSAIHATIPSSNSYGVMPATTTAGTAIGHYNNGLFGDYQAPFNINTAPVT